MKLHLPLPLFRALKRCYSWTAPLVATTALTLSTQETQALDATQGSVSYGDATIEQVGTDVLITQTSTSTIINWTDFNISAEQTVTFSQAITDIALNRVTGSNSTEIWGSLIADGNIFIINPNGILFGAGSTVDAAGLFATTLDIDDEDFKNATAEYTFTGEALAAIVNNGTITVKDDGFIYLVAARVENGETGSLIVGKSGTVRLGAGTSATIDFSGEGLVSFEVSGTVESKLKDGSDPGVENKGTIQAGNGGHVIMTADVKRDIVTSVINNSGSVEASSMDDLMGTVEMKGSGGAVSNTSAGSIVATSGEVKIEGDSVDNSGTISTAAADETEAGTVYITATKGAITGTGTSSNIIAENLNLYALSTDGGSIGSVYVYEVDGSSYITLSPLNTQVSNLYIETKSSLQDDGVASGNVSISNSNAGDLNVNINTNNGNMDGAGLSTVQIVNNDGGLTGSIIAHSGDLTAYGSISLEPSAFTTLSAAVSYTGDITIDNVSDYLTINSMNVAYEGEAAFDSSKNQVHKEGNISLSQTGTLVIAGTVSAGESITLSSEDSHILTSLYVIGDGDDATYYTLGTLASNALYLTAEGMVGDGLNIVVGGTDEEDAGLWVAAGTITTDDGSAGGVNLNSISEINVKQITATGTEGNVSLTTSIGDISLNADAGTLAIDATGSISLNAKLGSIYSYGQAGNVALNGTSLSLSAYQNILHMNDDGSTANLTTSDAVTEMTLSTSYGDIGITRGLSSSTEENDLWVSATADGDISVIQNGGGDMSLYLITGEGDITLTSNGTIAASDTSPALSIIEGSSLTLSAASIENGLSTAISGDGSTLNYQITASGNISMSNTGDILASFQLDSDASLSFENTGDLAIDSITAANVSLDVSGDISDGNGDTINITAENLTIVSADSFGSSADAIEVCIGNSTTAGMLNATVGTGGLYLVEGLASEDNTLTIDYISSYGNVSITSNSNLTINTITATQQEVSLLATGYTITAATPTYGSNNVSAYKLTLSAYELVGDLATNVTILSSTIATGDVDITNSGVLYIDVFTSTEPGQNLTYTGTSIIVFDNNGGTSYIGDTNVSLIASNGNVVFLNTEDTLVVSGTGSFTASASGTTSGINGYVGVVSLGNITAEGGDITISADSHISIGLLDAGTGNVKLSAGGYIIDNNGTTENIIANQVDITAYSLTDEELSTDYAYAMATTADYKILYQAYQADYQLCLYDQEEAQTIYNTLVALCSKTTTEYNELKDSAKETALASSVCYGLMETAELVLTAVKVADLTHFVAAMAAQAIPLTGDGGAATTWAAAESYITYSEAAIVALSLAYEVAEQIANDKENEFVQLAATLAAYKQDLANATITLQYANNKVSYISSLMKDTEYSLYAASELESVAAAALANKNAVGTEDLALGITANTVNITNIDGTAQTGAGSIYVQSSGSIGLNNIEAQGENAVVEVTAAGDVSLSGSISAGAGITVESTGGSISDAINSTLTTSSVGSFVDLFAAKDALVDDSTIQTEERATIIAQAGAVSLGDITAKGTDYSNDKYVVADPVVDSVIEVQAGTSLAVTGSLASEEYIILHAETGAITAGENNSLSTNQLVMKAASGIASSLIPLKTSVSYLAAESTSGDIMLDNSGDLTVYSTTVPSSSNVLAGVTVSGVSTSSGGDITLTADNIYIDAAISTAGDNSVVTLTATVGDITGTDNVYVPYHIAGDSAVLTAQTGIGSDAVALRSNIDTLKAEVLDTGNINMVEADDITVTEADTKDGSITLVAGGSIIAQNVISESDSATNFITLQALEGNITVGSLLAGETEGEITLIASGKVINDGITATEIYANNLDITAGTGIGVDLDNDVTALNTNVASLSAVTTKGSVHIDEQNDLLINKITATDEVTVTSTEGSLTVIEIDTAPSDNEDTNITLIAKNAILNGRDDAMAALKADELSLTAGTGIGTSDQAMDVEAESLAAESTSGGIYISDLEGGLSITSVTSNLGLASPTGVQAKEGEIVVETAGALSIEQLVEASDDVELTAKGGDITAKATVSTTSAGDLSMSAEGSIAASAALSATSGEITLNANKGSISTSNQASITADEDIFLNATGGSITLNAETKSAKAGDILLSATELAGQSGASDITLNAAMSTEDGYIALTADGAIDINASVKAQDVTNGDHNDIDPVDGELHLTAGTSVSIDASLSAVEDITILAGNGSITSTADILSSKGDITLTTQEDEESVDASIRLDGALTATAGGITISSADDISTTEDGSITAGQDLTLMADGSIETHGEVKVGNDVQYVAGKNIIITDDLLVTNSIELETKDGYIESIDAAISSNTGDISLTTNELTEDTNASITLDGAVTATVGLVTILSADDIETTENGSISSGDDMSLTAEGSITTKAKAFAKGHLSFLAGNNITIKADVSAGTELRLQTENGSIETIAAGLSSASGDIFIESYELDEATDASITLDGNVTASTGGLYVTSSDHITTTEDCAIDTITGVKMTASGNIATNGTILSQEIIQMDAFGTITTTGAIRSTNGNIALNSFELEEEVNANITIANSLTADEGIVTINSMDGVTTTANGDIATGMETYIFAEAEMELNGTIKSTGFVALQSDEASITFNADVQSVNAYVKALAETDIWVNSNLQAATFVQLISNSGALTGDMDMAGAHITAPTLEAEGATGVTLKTDVDELYGYITATGDFVLEEEDSIEAREVIVNNGAITLTAGGSIDATGLAITVDDDSNDISLVSQEGDIELFYTLAGEGSQGDVSLSAVKGSITQVTDALLVADNLTAEAGDSITMINTALQSADSLSTLTGDISLVESDGIDLGQINAAGGSANVTLTVGGDINDLDRDDSLATQAINITADKLTINAEGSIGNIDKLELDVNSIVAAAEDDLYLVQKGDLLIEEITANGTVEITSTEGSINGDTSVDTHITAQDIELKAETGIGNESTLHVESDSIAASTSTGDISLESKGDMKLQLLSTGDGSVRLNSTEGAILDTNGDDMNIEANSATLLALNGVGTDDALETNLGSLSALTTSGGIHINNSGQDLVLEDIHTESGDVNIKQLTGNLTVNQDIILPEGNDISLSAENTLYQNADIVTGNGDINLTAGYNIEFADGVRVDTGTGTLTLSSYLLNGLPDIYSRYVRIYTAASAGKYYIDPLFDDHRRIYAIWLNNRIVGGLVSDNATFVNEPFDFRHEKHDMGYSLLYQFGDYNKSSIDTSAYTIGEMMNVKGVRTWVYGD